MKNITLNGQSFSPTKIVCVGRNYVDHIYELNNEIPTSPVIFMKPNSSISNDIYSSEKGSVHYEAEISFIVISHTLFAVGFGLDLTKRDLQSELKSKGLPWERAKSFDKSAIFSDFVTLDFDVKKIHMELYINGSLTQHADCSLMIYKPEEILDDIHSFLTLEDGDVIMTGTPKGVGIVHQGDLFTGKIYNGDILIIEKSWIVQ